jgi:hypothetical protein
VNLTQGQVIAHCVPLASAMSTGVDDEFDQLTDIYFQSGPNRVTAQRQTAGGTITLGVYVVEFDLAYVRVQRTAGLAMPGTSTPRAITTVSSTTRAPLVFYHRGSFANHEYPWSRDLGPVLGAQPAHVGALHDGRHRHDQYVFEALNSGFTVQPLSFTIARVASGASDLAAPGAEDWSG